MKKISIITPTYNSGKYIRIFLNSIDRQILPEGYSLELLICDDGSFDSTHQIVSTFAFSDPNKSVRVFTNDANKGIAYCTNLLLAEAKGDIVVLIDSDVIPQDNQWLNNITMRIIDGEHCVVVGNFWKQYEHTRLSELHEKWRKAVYLRRYCFRSNQIKSINTRNAAFAVQILENIKNKYGYILHTGASRAGGDTELAKRIIQCGYKIYLCEQANVGHMEGTSYYRIIKQKARHGYADGKLSIRYRKNLIYSVYYPYVDEGVPIYFSLPITIVFAVSNFAGLMMAFIKKSGI